MIKIICDAPLPSTAAPLPPLQNAMTRDVLHQLQTISSQQSRIREIKGMLALLREAAARLESEAGRLLDVRRVAAAYRHCLAECARRAAFADKYSHSAVRLAENMGWFREKEAATRDSFRKHVERWATI